MVAEAVVGGAHGDQVGGVRAAFVSPVLDEVVTRNDGFSAPGHPTYNSVAVLDDPAGAVGHLALRATDAHLACACRERRPYGAVAQQLVRSQSGTARPSAQRAGAGSVGSMNQLAGSARPRSSVARRRVTDGPSRRSLGPRHIGLTGPEQRVAGFGRGRRRRCGRDFRVELAADVVAAVVVERRGH